MVGNAMLAGESAGMTRARRDDCEHLGVITALQRACVDVRNELRADDANFDSRGHNVKRA